MSFIPSIYEGTGPEKIYWDVYSRLLKDRVVWLSGPINDFVANAIVAQLLYLESTSRLSDIYLYINSPGGEVDAGMAIYDTMNFIQPDVNTICIGRAASMGAVLLSSGAKGKRFILPNAEVLIHQPLGGASGQASDIAIATAHILRCKVRLNNILAANTGQPLERIEKIV